MLNLTRTASAGAVGVASAALESQGDLEFGETKLAWSTLVEALAVAGGGLIQFMSPRTMPDMVDGVVEGGIALLAAKGTRMVMVMQQTKPVVKDLSRGQMNPLLAAGRSAPAMAYARGQIGNVSGVPKRTLT